MVGLIRGDGAIGVNANGPGTKQFVQSGDLRILAIAGERDPDLPDVKTFGEQGYPELDDLAIERWIGAGPGVDAEAVAILGEAIKKAATDPEFIEKAKADRRADRGRRRAATTSPRSWTRTSTSIRSSKISCRRSRNKHLGHSGAAGRLRLNRGE